MAEGTVNLKNELSECTINELRAMCRERKLPVHGNKQRLIDRLGGVPLRKPAGSAGAGRSDRYVGANLTRCRVCGKPVRVRSTQKKVMGDGRTLVVRNVMCAGKHRHRYPLKEVVGPYPADPAAAAAHGDKVP